MQFSPLPGQPDWKTLVACPDAKNFVRNIVDSFIAHGFSAVEYPFHLPPELQSFALEYVRARGLFLTFNHTFAKGGVEIFGRDAPPKVSVFSPDYLGAVKEKLEPVLAEAKRLPDVRYLFCYQDEPFHAGPKSFDTSDFARQEFKRKYGYDMPDVESARKSPRQWLDLLNFQSDTFPHGWRQVYKLVKQALPEVKVILTHDSHSALGAGVASNSKVAVDDVYHWGADFTDVIVFDIYPYMMFDFRYGELGKVQKPRLSQLHYSFAQLRNLTYSFGKELGFWFGTYNREWFKDFMGPELKQQSWAEAEICHTAVAQGADFLIAGYKVPEDDAHWNTLGDSLKVLHAAMPGLTACPKARATACFMFPRTQYLLNQQEYWNVAVAYELFLNSFGELDCLHEEQVAAGGLKDYEALVLFDVRLIPEAVANRIADFVKRGGLLIADCVPYLNANREPLAVLEDLFGAKSLGEAHIARTGVWVPKLEKPRWFIPPVPDHDEDLVHGEIVDGTAFGKSFYFRTISPRPLQVGAAEILLRSDKTTPGLTHRSVGKGHTYLLGFSMLDTSFATWKDDDLASRTALQDLLWLIAQQAGVKPRIRSSNPQIEASLRANSTEAYVSVINHEADRPHTRVEISEITFPIAAIHNLTEDGSVQFEKRARGLVFEIDVPRDRPQLLRLLPGSPAQP